MGKGFVICGNHTINLNQVMCVIYDPTTPFKAESTERFIFVYSDSAYATYGSSPDILRIWKFLQSWFVEDVARFKEGRITFINSDHIYNLYPREGEGLWNVSMPHDPYCSFNLSSFILNEEGYKKVTQHAYNLKGKE